MSLSLLHSAIAAPDRLCAYDHCRVPLPWFIWSRRTDLTSRLRRRILALEYGQPLSAVGTVHIALAACLHFLRGTREIVLVWRSRQAACRTGYGVPGGRQLIELFVSTFRYNFPPLHYYRARLFRITRSRWLDLFSHAETTRILAVFEQATQHLGLWTKSGWARFCADHGIPTIPVAAQAVRGELQVNEAAWLQPGRDLFLKPDRDYSGRGGVMLEWDAAANGWRASGAVSASVPGSALDGFLRSHSHDDAFVVQPRLRNAAPLADLAARALVNIRIVTLHAPDGTITLLMAALRLPLGDHPTSDVVGSTLCIPIDVATGEMGEGECARLEMGTCARHPLTGVPLKGRVIPEWPQMREQAIATHRLVPSVPSIGWDFVATETGVFILEANAVWNGYLAQHWGRAPLGETPWPALMLIPTPDATPEKEWVRRE